jgi:hypothetical protein
VTYTVVAPPAPPPPLPPPPERIIVVLAFDAPVINARATVFDQLLVKEVPADSTVVATCKPPRGKKCPAKRLTKVGARNQVKLSKWVKRKLAPGTKLTVNVTKPGTIGAVKVLTVRKAKRPSITTKCLPPGAKAPARCT